VEQFGVHVIDHDLGEVPLWVTVDKGFLGLERADAQQKND
jgi:hypothetical protein